MMCNAIYRTVDRLRSLVYYNRCTVVMDHIPTSGQQWWSEKDKVPWNENAFVRICMQLLFGLRYAIYLIQHCFICRPS
jgi:hypothetical protein